MFGLLVPSCHLDNLRDERKGENQNTVRLSTDNKDVTITDVKAQLRRTPPAQAGGGTGQGTIPVDIERMRQLIINSEMPPEEEYGRKADTASISFPQENLDSITRELRKKKKKQEKKKVGEEGRDKGSPSGRDKIQHGRLAQEQQAERHPHYVHSDQGRDGRIHAEDASG